MVIQRQAGQDGASAPPPTDAPPSHRPMWQVVKQYVEERVSLGAYPIGSWLPSIRALAAELRINRNTVSKVYQALAREGTVESVRGAGVRVVRLPNRDNSAEARLHQAAEALFREAKLLGIPQQRIVDRITQIALEVYGSWPIRVAFIECSFQGARSITEDLSRHIGLRIDPVALDELVAHPGAYAARFDLLSTTFFHLQEVSDVLSGHDVEVVGIRHEPSHEFGLRVARLPRGATIGIVCPNQRTLELVRMLVNTYAQVNVLGCTIEDRPMLQRIAREAELIVDTVTSRGTLLDHIKDIPRLTVDFHIEQQSIEYLRSRVRECARRVLAHPSGGPPVPVATGTRGGTDLESVPVIPNTRTFPRLITSGGGSEERERPRQGSRQEPTVDAV